jgi:hypothetical protein
MLLIETTDKSGKLVRAHYRAVCLTQSEAASKIAWMTATFGDEWIHRVRATTDAEVRDAIRAENDAADLARREARG